MKNFLEASNRSDDPTRRSFLAGLAATTLGVTALPRVGAAAQFTRRVPRARNVIFVYLSGGMSHVDTFDPKPERREVMGPMGIARSSVDGIALGQHLPLLAQRLDRATLIRSMWSNQGAHVQGRYFLHTSYSLRGTIRHPSLGAWLTHADGPDNPTLPPHVTVGGDQYGAASGYLPQSTAPLPIGDPGAGLQASKLPKGVDQGRFDRRLERLRRMNEEYRQNHPGATVDGYDTAYEQAVSLMQSADLQAFDLSLEDEATRAAYGSSKIGQGCLLARRLVEHDVRFVEVVSGNWDTHVENFEALEERLPDLDRALATLISDLEARGLLEDTLLVVASEFGRTPRITEGRNGRDHHPQAFSTLLAGGGIRRGHVHGRTDELGEEVVEGKVTVPDFNATIAHALGLPIDHEFQAPSGRPFKIADKGRPVLEVFE
ncbi:MAG: DUF1501 domain-containing protein [Planctomycetota bacterium]